MRKTMNNFLSLKFPSPCGEVVMKAQEFELALNYLNEMFPSPCGEVVMKAQTGDFENGKVTMKHVFPSPCGEEVMKDLVKLTVTAEVMKSEFPSPCGEVVMKVQNLWQSDCPDEETFPSPCGEVVMKVFGQQLKQYGRYKLTKFPSPCGEVVMKAHGVDARKAIFEEVSVPLRGSGDER